MAERAGVSHQTVSRVLNDASLVKEETRLRVLSAIEELGYRRNYAARLLATNRSRRIGIVSAHLALHGPSMIATAVQEAGQAEGYDVSLVGLSEFSPRRWAAPWTGCATRRSRRSWSRWRTREAAEMTRSLQLSIPVVMVQGVAAGQPLSAGIDQEAGARLAVGSPARPRPPPRRPPQRAARLGGGRRAAERAGARRTRCAACCPGPELDGDWSPASGYRAGLRIADDGDVTAVFAGNDSMALGLLKALHERGRRVPDDVSVVGFDDVPEAAYYWPALTTVAQDFSELGRRALGLALAAVRGDQDAAVDQIEPTLVVRGSTGPPPPRG